VILASEINNDVLEVSINVDIDAFNTGSCGEVDAFLEEREEEDVS
jgi:hypothetical protein